MGLTAQRHTDSSLQRFRVEKHVTKLDVRHRKLPSVVLMWKQHAADRVVDHKISCFAEAELWSGEELTEGEMTDIKRCYLKTVIHHQKGWLTINLRDAAPPLWAGSTRLCCHSQVSISDTSKLHHTRLGQGAAVTGWSYTLKLRGGVAFVEVWGAGGGTTASWTSVSVPLSGRWAFVCPKCWQADMDMADYSEALDPAYTTLEFENMQVLPLGTGECADVQVCRWTLRLLLI